MNWDMPPHKEIVIDNNKAKKAIDDFCSHSSRDEEYRGLEWLLARNSEHFKMKEINPDVFLYSQIKKSERYHNIKILFRVDDIKVYIIAFEAIK